MMNDQSQKLHTTWLILKLTYGLVPVVAGADKFMNVLAKWENYLNPVFLKFIPLSATHFMYLVGIIEIAAGLLVLSKYTRYGAYLVAVWLVALATNLASLGMYDIAVRDVIMALGAVVLAQLTDICSAQHRHI